MPALKTGVCRHERKLLGKTERREVHAVSRGLGDRGSPTLVSKRKWEWSEPCGTHHTAAWQTDGHSLLRNKLEVVRASVGTTLILFTQEGPMDTE